MPGLIAPLLCAIAGICGLTAVQYFLLAWHRWRRAAHLEFALLSLSIAGFELATLFSYDAKSVADYVSATRWLADFGCLGAVFAVWFAANYSETKRGRLLWTLTAGFGLLIVANHVLPAGLILRPGGSLSRFTLPWGETIAHIRGAFNPWAYAYYAAFAFVGVYCLAAGRRVRRAGRVRRGLALSFGASIMAVAMASDVLMEQQLWEKIYLSDYAFLPLVVIMNAALVAELVGSHQRLQRLAEASFEGIFMTREARIVDANEQLLKMFGYTRQGLLGRLAYDLVVPDQHAAVAGWIAANTGGSQETIGLRADGSQFPIEFRPTLLTAEGPRTYFTTVRDITERKAALAALKASGEKYAKVFRNSPDAILITRAADGQILETNDRFSAIYGHPHQSAVGRTTVELQLWASAEDRAHVVAEVRRVGHLRDREFDFRRSDGAVRIGLLSVEAIEIQGEACMVSIVRDITERRCAERALQASEERFALAVRGTTDGIWDWDVPTSVIYYSPRFRELLGYPADEFPDLLKSFTDRLHPDDSEKLWAAVNAHLDRRVPYDIDCRLRHRDGAYRWFRSRGQAVWDAAGRAVRMAGSISDIHDHREAEAALSRREAELRAIFEGAAIGIVLIGPDYRPLARNPAFLRLLGYSDEELRETTFAKVTHPDDLAEDTELYRRLLSGESDYHQSEKRYVRRDGTLLWARRTLSSVPAAGSRSRCVISMVEDISAQKQSEESLRLARDREAQAHAEFTRRLLLAQEQERKRLATELHDSLGQHLSLIKNRATLALEQPAVPPAAAKHLDNIVEVITAAIGEVRNLALHLRPLHLEKFGLTSSLESLLDQVAGSSVLRLDRRVENVDDLLPGDDAVHVYRILQELLNNLLRHAHATRARVAVERDVHCVRLRVEDDGRGFDPAALVAGGGLGLTSIRERVALLHGRVEFRSAPGAGTRVCIELPVTESPGG